MIGKIFQEYLLWFDGQMVRKQVPLPINGFLAHLAVLNLFYEKYSQGLDNTKVIFLSPNATFVYQPLNQTIIKAWKAHYKRKLIYFLYTKYDKNKDLLKTINVL